MSAGEAVVIAAAGPVLVGSRRELERRVAKGGMGPVVIDLARAEHIDSSGVATLIELAGRMRSQGRALVLAAPGAGVRRLFELTRLDERIPVFATVEAALGAAGEEGRAGGEEGP